MLDLVRPRPGAAVLDAGCGCGATLGLLQTGGVRAVGLDMSKVFLREASAVGAGVAQADLAFLPCMDAGLDLILCECAWNLTDKERVLAEKFAGENDASMCWVKAGSGQSLKLLKAKEVNMVMVHAPAAEKKAVEEGWALKRTLIGSNEFYIVGPAADPAGISGAKDAADAYRRIAEKKSLFFSRGDNSGTHKKEMDAWKNAGVTPSGDWYVVTKDFMMATLKRADKEGGYFMTDSSTWVAARKELSNLKILFRGDRPDSSISWPRKRGSPSSWSMDGRSAVKASTTMPPTRSNTIARR
jgi:hypothetical protein